MRFYREITHAVLTEIRSALGEEAIINEPERLLEYAKDGSQERFVPELAVAPSETGQIQALLRLANAHSFPVTPRGLGSGLAGACLPNLGGVVLSLARMKRILDIDPANLYAVAEPGVITLDLKNAVQAQGLFYPPDPASIDISSIGGNAATDAGGPACVKYGTTRQYVLGLEAVLPSGEIIRTGTHTRKGVVGYDMTRLLVGSEGTLGVITKLILKLIPLPPATASAVAVFPDLNAAMRAVSGIMAAGFSPSAIEFLDSRCLGLVGSLLPFPDLKDSGALLLLEADGSAASVEPEIAGMGEVCRSCGATHLQPSGSAEERERMWWVRRQVSLRIHDHAEIFIPEDVAVPIGRIAELVGLLPAIESRYGLTVFAFGHAGDGNIHLNITATHASDPILVETGVREILGAVLAMNGTMSGEHGIGIAKKRFIPLELSPTSIALQKNIKRLFDPNMILNPGKIFE